MHAVPSGERERERAGESQKCSGFPHSFVHPLLAEILAYFIAKKTVPLKPKLPHTTNRSKLLLRLCEISSCAYSLPRMQCDSTDDPTIPVRVRPAKSLSPTARVKCEEKLAGPGLSRIQASPKCSKRTVCDHCRRRRTFFILPPVSFPILLCPFAILWSGGAEHDREDGCELPVS